MIKKTIKSIKLPYKFILLLFIIFSCVQCHEELNMSPKEIQNIVQNTIPNTIPNAQITCTSEEKEHRQVVLFLLENPGGSDSIYNYVLIKRIMKNKPILNSIDNLNELAHVEFEKWKRKNIKRVDRCIPLAKRIHQNNEKDIF